MPGEHPVLPASPRGDGSCEVRYAERHYAAPRADVIVLPINNTSSENLAGVDRPRAARRARAALPRRRVRALRVAVEETGGQRGVYHYDSDGESP